MHETGVVWMAAGAEIQHLQSRKGSKGRHAAESPARGQIQFGQIGEVWERLDPFQLPRATEVDFWDPIQWPAARSTARAMKSLWSRK